ncbi:MAG TPA: hypothetical protein VF006_03330 [Longimicrobium sp.]
MKHRTRSILPALLCLVGACGSEAARQQTAAPDTTPVPSATMTYAACMAAANRQASQVESVVKARECLRLPDAPPPGSTLPPGTPPPPGAVRGVDQDTAPAAQAEVRSVYTSLQQCRLMSTHEETGGTVSRCPGVARHALLMSDDDARMSIDVVTPDGREHPLNYWSVVTGAFSALGPRAEWRMQGERPIALIVRVNANEDAENPERTTSYLAVAKITPTQICVTDRIGPAADANAAARRAADASAARPCVKEAPM